MKEAKLLKHEKVSAYVKNNLDLIRPYYFGENLAQFIYEFEKLSILLFSDIFAVFIHLLCLSFYCVICATRQKSVDDKDKSHELQKGKCKRVSSKNRF